MKNEAQWKPTKFVSRQGRLRASTDVGELAVGSRLVADLVAARYQSSLSTTARGRLLDLGCGKVPLYAAYAPFVDEVVCVDWAPGEHVDFSCDLAHPLPFADRSFDTIVLSDVLEHVPEPELLWREMTRVLAMNGKIVLNVPFYYAIHAHPHDYYRYTNFALERFARLNELNVLQLQPIGGIVEVMSDLVAKSLSKVPLIGPPLAMLTQFAARFWARTTWGQRVAQTSSRHFPLGYFMVAQRIR